MTQIFKNAKETFKESCHKPGTLETLSYTSNSYDAQNLTTQKNALVYLPHGYDPAADIRYNVLYLMHGGGGSYEEFFGGLNANTVLKPMLDQMIEAGTIEPLIVVTPSFYYEGTQAALHSVPDARLLTENYHQELMKDLIPAVEASYSVGLHRKNRAFGGFSMGSEATWNVFGRCLKDFKYFLPMCGDYWVVKLRGGLECPVETVDHLVQTVHEADCDFLITACVGDEDIAYKPMDSLLTEMKKRPEFRIQDVDSDFAADSEANVLYYVEPKAVHSYDYVFKYIQMALPKLFR